VKVTVKERYALHKCRKSKCATWASRMRFMEIAGLDGSFVLTVFFRLVIGVGKRETLHHDQEYEL
jgi:hypothetical protein